MKSSGTKSFQEKVQEREQKRKRSAEYRADRAIEKSITFFQEKAIERKLLAMARQGKSHYSKRLFVKVHAPHIDYLEGYLHEAVRDMAIINYAVKNGLHLLVSYDYQSRHDHGYKATHVTLHVRWDESVSWDTIVGRRRWYAKTLILGKW